jgi:hypothetical protein
MALLYNRSGVVSLWQFVPRGSMEAFLSSVTAEQDEGLTGQGVPVEAQPLDLCT